jgi:carbonic anhydrase/acetyltransferase-like protein (isoleucine patch superfamily)
MVIRSNARAEPFVLPFDDVMPQIAGELVCGPGASLLGKVEIGPRAFLGPYAVIRADGHFVRIGGDFSFGERATIHIAHDIYPTVIGERVTLGRYAVAHACTVGSRTFVGDGAVILDGSVVEDDVLIEAGSVVFPRSNLARGFLYEGRPAKQIRAISPDEIERRAQDTRQATERLIATSVVVYSDPAVFASHFVAKTALLSGTVHLHKDASIFFSCVVDGRKAPIEIGENTNVQDNTDIIAAQRGCTIGSDTTIGHNVRIFDSHIGKGSLIGMGAILNAGTVIEDDVFLAAGAETAAGQVLESGWLWGGNPVRPLSKLDDKKRALMRITIQGYCLYAAAYRETQAKLGSLPVRA